MASGDIRPTYYQVKVKVFTDDAQDEKEVRTLECFDLIDALADGDFYMGNALKYLFRSGKKDDVGIADIRKAITYLNQICERKAPF